MDLASTGLYTTNEIINVELIGESLKEYNKDSILRKITSLKSSGESLATTGTQESSFGAYVKDNELKMNGRVIAQSNVENPGIYETDSTNFSDVSLAPHRKCINITLENYNKLRNGQVVPGYKVYDKYLVYNIVNNINNAETVYYNPNGRTNLIYASAVGNILPENTVTSNTFTLMDAPTLAIRDFELRVKINEPLLLLYYVDTRRSEALYENNYGETFTTIIKDKDGTILSKKTSYAGELYTSIVLRKDTKGDTWFSILCIDSRGVESPILYFDVFIDDDVQEEVYQITEEDLAQHHITFMLDNDEDLPDFSKPDIYDPDIEFEELRVKGFFNRIGLTKLFADLKAQGHNNVAFPINKYGRTYRFYIDIHKNINSEFNYDTFEGSVDFGTLTYYYAKITAHTPYVVGEEVKGSTIELTEILPDNGKSPLQLILEDTRHLHRDSNGKIKVYWGEQYVSLGEVHSTSNPLHVESLSKLTKLKAIKIDDLYYYPPAYVLEEEDRELYVVNSTVYFEGDLHSAGDPILFPNDFTVNFNGASFIMIPTEEISIGTMMQLRGNYNTHIIGGSGSKLAEIKGMYKSINFKRAFIKAAYWNPGEFLHNWNVSSSRFCSVTNIKSTYSLGYDGTIGNSSHVPDYIENWASLPHSLDFTHLGYIGYNGNVNNDTTPVAELVADSPDRLEGATHIGLVYTDYAYCKIAYWDPVLNQKFYSPDLFIGPLGYGRYLAGKLHEIFVSFYKKSGNNYNWISTIKTHLYYLIKIPPEADHFRVCGYGITKKSGNTYVSVANSDGINKAFPQMEYEGKIMSKNILYKGCSWSHTRTIAMSVSYAKSITIDDCGYTLIAIESSKNGFGVTQMLGDFEEGWEHTDRVTIKNCRIYAGLSYTYNVFGSVYILMNCGRNLTMINNRTEDKKTSMALLELGGIESAYICNNVFSVGEIRRRPMYEHPCIVYEDNEYRDYLDLREFNPDIYNALVLGTSLRYNRCDDPVIDKVVIRNSIIPVLKRTPGVKLKVRVEDSNIEELEITNSNYE